MFSAFEWMMAARYLRARRQEGFISVIAVFSLLGIALGVATLIIVMSVMNGFRAELLGRILGLNGHVVVQGPQGPLPDHAAVAERLRSLDFVVAAFPIAEGQVMATAHGTASGALVRGMKREDIEPHSIVAQHLLGGSLADFQGDGVLLGSRLAQKLGLAVGDRVTLLSAQTNVTPFGQAPRSKAYVVAGLFEIGMFEYDSSFIFMPLDSAQVFFRLGDAVSGVEALVADPDAVAGYRRDIFAAIGPGHRVTDWQQANSNFFGALQVERNVMFLILTLIILVAAFNIISSLIMLVNDKARQIAILRTMGATRGSVMRIFFLAGAAVGLVGTVSGFALGLAFCDNIEAIRRWIEGLSGAGLFPAEIYFLSQLPAKVDPTEVGVVVTMALGLSLLATIYPAWRAARVDPVEALRYE
jgi:lipoprotein-releasing system permease protein